MGLGSYIDNIRWMWMDFHPHHHMNWDLEKWEAQSIQTGISGNGVKWALSREYSMYAALMERSIVSLTLGLLLLGQRLPPNISGTWNPYHSSSPNSVNLNKWDKFHKVDMNSLTSSWRCEKLWSYFFHPSGLSIIKHLSLQGFWISKPSGGEKSNNEDSITHEGRTGFDSRDKQYYDQIFFFRVSVHIKLSHFWGSYFFKQISAF